MMTIHTLNLSQKQNYKSDGEIVSSSNSDVSWKPENDIGGDVNDTCSAVERSREENLSDVSDSDFSDKIDTPGA